MPFKATYPSIGRSKRANSIASSDLRKKAIAGSSKRPRQSRLLHLSLLDILLTLIIGVQATGKEAYLTRVPSGTESTAAMYIVLKGTWNMSGNGGEPVWVENRETMRLIVEDKPFANGVTKKVFKVCYSAALSAY